MLLNIIVILIGLLISRLLFNRFPGLKKNKARKRQYQVSIIIPARNEEVNLALLLRDLEQQVEQAYEIICVDDGSTDDTARVASTFGVKLIAITDKPADWTGKSWACQKGAEAARGDILLFLDADVRLSSNAISCLVKTYDEMQCVISVQPYHQMVKNYEQFSLFFNLIQIAGNGTSMIYNCKNVGLYGPVILISQENYKAIEGHLSAKNSIVDDLALGEKLTKKGFPYKLFLGGEEISFRMYGGGFLDLLHGWTKNYATGALKTPMVLLIMVFWWVTSCTSVIISLLQSIITQDFLYFMICSLLYVLWILELFRIAQKIGNFKKLVLISYPVYMILFLWVFTISLFKKLFHMNVVWKGRKIRLEK